MSSTGLRSRLFAHLETWRPYTAFYVGLVGMAGAELANPDARASRVLAAWAIPTLGWLAGLYGGDYFDRALDAEAKPHRPIPSGRMPAWVALAAMIGCSLIGAVLSLVLNWRTVLLVVAALVVGILYSTVFKGRGLSGNLVRGSMTAFAFLYGTMMVGHLPPSRVLPIALVFLAHDTASNLVGAVRDIEGDRAGGYRTFAVQHPVSTSLRVISFLLCLAYGLALATPAILSRSWSTGFVIGLILAVATAVWALAPLFQVRGPVRRPAYRAHAVLVFTRILLAGSLLVWTLGVAVAVPIVIAALAATWISQRLLRERHEFSGSRQPELTEAAVLAFVDGQLGLLADDPSALSSLAGWNRVIDVRLSEPALELRLVSDGGRLTRVEADHPQTAPVLTITTTGRVFQDIFLLHKSNPRRAYLSRQLSMQASAADMIRLNQLFNRFRTITGADATTPGERRTELALVSEVSEVSAEGDPALTVVGTVVISDTTLRDGEQMPGVVFSPGEKLQLARLLDELGIPLIEAGFPAVSADEAGAIRAIVEDRAAAGRALIQVIARPVDTDIDAAISTGAHSIAIFIGTSDSHLRTKLRMSVDDARRAVDSSVRRAKRAGRQVVFAAEDATRSDPDVLRSICLAAAEAGADALGVADTVGIANPASIAALVRRLSAEVPLPLAVHCHNDLGLATANSLASVLAGASGIQCSVLGIGERAGNAPLEQVVLALQASLGHDSGLDTTKLQALAEYVAGLVGVSIAPFQPVVGGHAFTHESGLHLDGIVQDPSTYEPYLPELLGRQRRIVLGKHSGVSAVLAVAEAAGIELDKAQARTVLSGIKQLAQDKQFPALDAVQMVRRFAPRPAEVGAATRFQQERSIEGAETA
jgi:isopropylmalate/homocitrate/citramalate synthase/4-hydroxybenzoate polyprenyltransferase